MSNQQNDDNYQRIWDDIDDHIDAYFRDMADDESNEELLEFIFDHKEVWEYLRGKLAGSKIGDKIAQEVFENLPEGPEEDGKSDD